MGLCCPARRLWMLGIILLSHKVMMSLPCLCLPLSDCKLNNPLCCAYEQQVNASTVMYDGQVVNSPQNGWSVQANFSWARPPGYYFDGYAVETVYDRAVSQASCILDNPNYQLTRTEWIYLTNLRFGYDVRIHVYSANLTARVRNRATPISREFELPDISVISKPVGLRVDNITTWVDAKKDTPVGMFTVFWHPPVQIAADKMIGEFEVWVIRSDSQLARIRENVVLTPGQMMYNNPFDVSFEQSFQMDVPFNWTEDIEITVQGFLNSGNKSCRTNSKSLQCNGRTAFLLHHFDITTNTTKQQILNHRGDVIWVTVAFFFGAVVVLLVVICFNCRRRRTITNIKSVKDTKPKPVECFLKKEFDRSLLRSITEIGRGSFGVVYKGVAFGSLKGIAGFYPVAVKSIKGIATEEMKKLFLDEIELMIEIGSHPNILTLLGCCTIEEPYLLLTEFMKYGDLLHFMWKSRESKAAEEDSTYKVTELPKLQIARQIARGMEYISAIRYYHGDLAARNVLVGANLQIKVSDFGLAADIYERGYKRLKSDDRRPIKWASLETNTTGKCSIESDVWSFGIVLYEIFTLGDAPYQGIENSDLIPKLKQGYRLDQPEDCSLEVYDIMRQCWLEHSLLRPSFTKLTELLEGLLAQHSDYMDLEESAAGIDGIKSEQVQSTEMSTISGEPDELNLWLHVTGEIPESFRTLDFVPMTEEGTFSDDSIQCLELENLKFDRFPDSDIVTLTV